MRPGDLLAALRPGYGIGVDLSGQMIRRAGFKHPHLQFIQGDAHALPMNCAFDAVILSDLVNDAWDVQGVFSEVARIATPSTRLILNSYSRLWEGPLEITRRMGWSNPTLFENWLTVADLTNLLWLSGLETIRSWPEVLFPLRLPVVTNFLNKILGPLLAFPRTRPDQLRRRKSLSTAPCGQALPCRLSSRPGTRPATFRVSSNGSRSWRTKRS